jgi:uncharacterized membrane protein YcjF (UPF0283 family)
MSTDPRQPGPVIGDAKPIDSTKEERASPTSETPRQPGPVLDPGVPLPPPDTVPKAASLVENERSELSIWGLVAYTTLALIAFLAIWHWSGFLGELWQYQIWLAALLSILTTGFALALGRALFVEYRAAQRFDQLMQRNRKIETALQENRLTELQSALAQTISSLRGREPHLIAEFEEATRTREADPKDFARLFETLVLSELDKEAQAEIKRQSLIAGGAVAVLPHPALDAIVVLWRASNLIRRIGEIYGLQPTGLSSVRLMKQAITSAVLAAGLDTAGEVFGENIVKKVFGKTAEAGVTAIRMWRLGKTTQMLCRPIPPPD